MLVNRWSWQAAEALPFYFVVYPVPGRCACAAQISLLRNGKSIAEASRDLPTKQTKRLQHVGNLPIADLPAGTYELRVTVTDSQDQQTRTAFFTVKDEGTQWAVGSEWFVVRSS